MSELSLAQLREIPKIDLHRHLDCSMRWSTLRELAPQVGIELPQDPGAQREHFLITQPMRDLESVLKKFLRAQKVLASEEILERLAFEACEDAFNDGLLAVELRFAPTFISDGHPSLTNEKILAAFKRGIDRAMKTYPMAAGLIAIIQRIKPVKEAERVCDFVIANKDAFIALDLADNEEGFDARPFALLFQKAKKAGMHITIHSGETPTALAPQWVRDSVEIMGAERIGHGIQIIQDPATIDFVRAKKIPLEVCPLSNWLTQAFPTFETHPVKKLWNAGVDIAICSDDPGIFGSTLTDDYAIMHQVHGFTRADFDRANDIAARASFLDKKLLAKVWPRPIPQ